MAERRAANGYQHQFTEIQSEFRRNVIEEIDNKRHDATQPESMSYLRRMGRQVGRGDALLTKKTGDNVAISYKVSLKRVPAPRMSRYNPSFDEDFSKRAVKSI